MQILTWNPLRKTSVYHIDVGMNDTETRYVKYWKIQTNENQAEEFKLKYCDVVTNEQ